MEKWRILLWYLLWDTFKFRPPSQLPRHTEPPFEVNDRKAYPGSVKNILNVPCPVLLPQTQAVSGPACDELFGSLRASCGHDQMLHVDMPWVQSLLQLLASPYFWILAYVHVHLIPGKWPISESYLWISNILHYERTEIPEHSHSWPTAPSPLPFHC